MISRLLIALCVSIISTSAMAWDGYDSDSASNIQIDGGNLVREGETIEIYDGNTGEYHDAEVQSISDYGYSVDVEVYDFNTGEYRILEMED